MLHKDGKSLPDNPFQNDRCREPKYTELHIDQAILLQFFGPVQSIFSSKSRLWETEQSDSITGALRAAMISYALLPIMAWLQYKLSTRISLQMTSSSAPPTMALTHPVCKTLYNSQSYQVSFRRLELCSTLYEESFHINNSYAKKCMSLTLKLNLYVFSERARPALECRFLNALYMRQIVTESFSKYTHLILQMVILQAKNRTPQHGTGKSSLLLSSSC